MSSPIKIPRGYSLQRAQQARGQTIPEAYDKKMREVSKLYETQFLRQMHKAMKGTVHKSGFIKEGMAEKIFQEKLDNKYIDQWGAKGGVGLANIIYNQLKERVLREQHGFIPQPQGPIEIKKGTMLRVDETVKGPDQSMLPLPASERSLNEVNFILESPKEPGSKGAEVSMPWDGVVRQVVVDEEGRTTLRVDHPDNMESTLSFNGRSIPLKEGQSLNAGAPIGRILQQPQQMTWKVRGLAKS